MASATNRPNPADPFDLQRFVLVQEPDYARALAEIKAGNKRTHWMWYIFPQLQGLGSSWMAQRYAIKRIEEAKAYLEHRTLGARLRECAEALLKVDGRTATEIFGNPDDLKLKSCATLFASVLGPGSVFQQILDKYYGGHRDERTLQLLEKLRETHE